jgi:hypothetical protein
MGGRDRAGRDVACDGFLDGADAVVGDVGQAEGWGEAAPAALGGCFGPLDAEEAAQGVVVEAGDQAAGGLGLGGAAGGAEGRGGDAAGGADAVSPFTGSTSEHYFFARRF